jgi:hypothetical protein
VAGIRRDLRQRHAGLDERAHAPPESLVQAAPGRRHRRRQDREKGGAISRQPPPRRRREPRPESAARTGQDGRYDRSGTGRRPRGARTPARSTGMCQISSGSKNAGVCSSNQREDVALVPGLLAIDGQVGKGEPSPHGSGTAYGAQPESGSVIE